MGNPAINVSQALPLPPIYYRQQGPSYWVEDAAGKRIKINETSAKITIRTNGYGDGKTDGVSECEKCLLDKIPPGFEVVRRTWRLDDLGATASWAGWSGGAFSQHQTYKTRSFPWPPGIRAPWGVLMFFHGGVVGHFQNLIV